MVRYLSASGPSGGTSIVYTRESYSSAATYARCSENRITLSTSSPTRKPSAVRMSRTLRGLCSSCGASRQQRTQSLGALRSIQSMHLGSHGAQYHLNGTRRAYELNLDRKVVPTHRVKLTLASMSRSVLFCSGTCGADAIEDSEEPETLVSLPWVTVG
jgi:hypothetical protein